MPSAALANHPRRSPPPLPEERAVAVDHAARIALEVAGRLRTDFALNLGQELKRPLDAISGLSRFIGSHGREPLASADIVDYAKLIDGATQHILSFLSGILDLARLESGDCALDASDVRVDSVLLAALAALEPAAREAGVALSWSAPPGLPVVRGDGAKLYEVFVRLAGYAIAASERGGEVSAEASATFGDGVVVVIRDGGARATEEEIAFALRPLGFLDSSRTRWRDGGRMGLRIAKAYVELHGGRLSIANAEGRGTEVAVTLPGPAP